MNRKHTDHMAEYFLKSESGSSLSKEYIYTVLGSQYSRDQKERIYYRYRYLSEKLSLQK